MKMLHSERMWNVPDSFRGQTGVLVGRIDPNTLLMHQPGIGWRTYTPTQWQAQFSTEFPKMCPMGGWCIIPAVRASNGHTHQYAITPDILGYALQDEADLAGLQVGNRANTLRKRDEIIIERTRGILQADRARVNRTTGAVSVPNGNRKPTIYLPR